MKRLLLLFIPLVFFFSCENEEEGGSANSIVGTWRDNIEGNWVVIMAEESVPGLNSLTNTISSINAHIAILEEPNYMLTSFNRGMPCDYELSIYEQSYLYISGVDDNGFFTYAECPDPTTIDMLYQCGNLTDTDMCYCAGLQLFSGCGFFLLGVDMATVDWDT